MAGYDRFFGFDLVQRRTLAKLLLEVQGAGTDTVAQLQEAIADLEDRVEAVENAAE